MTTARSLSSNCQAHSTSAALGEELLRSAPAPCSFLGGTVYGLFNKISMNLLDDKVNE